MREFAAIPAIDIRERYACPSISFLDNPTIIISGAVDLPLVCAASLSGEHRIGILGGRYARERRAQRILRTRLHCYELVPGFPKRLRRKLSSCQLAFPRRSGHSKKPCIRICLCQSRRMFHSTLYDWLIDRGLADDLLEVSRCS